jgi:hypothetical protein
MKVFIATAPGDKVCRVTQGDEDCHGEHDEGRDCPSNVEEQKSVPEQRRVGTAQQSEIADNEENSNLCRTEDALRKLKARQCVGGQIALARQEQECHQHRDRRLPVQESRVAESAHQRDGSKDVHHVVHVKAIAWTLLLAYSSEGSIHAVSEPVKHQAENHQQQGVPVESRNCIANARPDLCAQAEQGELV